MTPLTRPEITVDYLDMFSCCIYSSPMGYNGISTEVRSFRYLI